jgi:hypothetical protein
MWWEIGFTYGLIIGDICNPYNPGNLANRVSIENYIEIITKPNSPVATNKEYCFTEVFASGGVCGAPTGEFFEVTAASVAGSTEIKWYNTLADANADINAIASGYGANCRFLRPENRAGGVGSNGCSRSVFRLCPTSNGCSTSE